MKIMAKSTINKKVCTPPEWKAQLAVISVLQWVFSEQLLGVMSIGKVVDQVVAFQGLGHTNRTAD